MSYLLKGALVEYSGGSVLGPIPNVVIFQFNPETLSRTIEVPERPTSGQSNESSKAGELPVEKISLTAHFSAADELATDNILARALGVGPRLAALEKMVHPGGALADLMGEALDAIGDAIFGADDDATQCIPRVEYPKVLFIWGVTRILPVIIDSMKIDEKKYDFLLNPVQAEVSLGLSVISPEACGDDIIARGASQYSSIAKETMMASNLANTVSQAVDLIPF